MSFRTRGLNSEASKQIRGAHHWMRTNFL